jgi:rhodanese-related sulfurtransferase
MHKVIIGALILATIIITGIALTRSTPLTAPTSHADAPSHMLSNSTKVFDVRTPEEYAASHAKDAVLLPLADIQAGAYPSVPKDTDIAVYCRSGNRSSQAAAILRKAGFTNVTDLGGIDDAKTHGLEFVSP